jgi:hypothetical protein
LGVLGDKCETSFGVGGKVSDGEELDGRACTGAAKNLAMHQGARSRQRGGRGGVVCGGGKVGGRERSGGVC